MVNYAAVRDLLINAQFELDGGDMQSERISKAIDYLIEVVEDECPKTSGPKTSGPKTFGLKTFVSKTCRAQVIPFPQDRRLARM
ncbi:hypothetical protein [Bradyrhizobium prioriisuperbiae]|uniref:hypothetical protein n=1 Tax=Bradyrhizobium prioriisuperbiae TaxID=2854389 RepID=UPI0028EF3A15|nr:hypothetical protein [Bradyrhizobium prioritasuperba]